MELLHAVFVNFLISYSVCLTVVITNDYSHNFAIFNIPSTKFNEYVTIYEIVPKKKLQKCVANNKLNDLDLFIRSLFYYYHSIWFVRCGLF